MLRVDEVAGTPSREAGIDEEICICCFVDCPWSKVQAEDGERGSVYIMLTTSGELEDLLELLESESELESVDEEEEEWDDRD